MDPESNIYTLKFALLFEQMEEYVEVDFLKEIRSFAGFIVLYYIKPWYTAGNAFDAPSNDLEQFKYLQQELENIQSTTEVYPSEFSQMMEVFIEKT